jgi:uncharacterized membrane protein YoaK (UPF0700 family)
MFRDDGTPRSEPVNRLLAGYLAFVGGYVNAAGFVVIGAFTSHVTGNVGHFARYVALRQFEGALGAGLLIIAFFVGAFVASMMIESDVFKRPPHAYGAAVLAEAALLLSFSVVPLVLVPDARGVQSGRVALLCAAMGIQNSLVTRLSGAVVRTTHLTGVVTDLGIEAARWWRWFRELAARRTGLRLAWGRNPAVRPQSTKWWLLFTIAAAFSAGAVAGSVIAALAQPITMIVPAALLLVAAYYTLAGPSRVRQSIPPGPNTRR